MTDENASFGAHPADSAPPAVNLAAVQADDTLVEAVRNGEPDGSALTGLLLAWKQEIDAVPFPAQPDLAAAEHALTTRTRQRSRQRLLTPVAAAAAAMGIALSSLALVAHDSQPGDPLWGVARVVYADHARSVAAASQAQTELGLAQQALAAGSPEAARAALDRVTAELRGVQDADRRAQLFALYAMLIAQLDRPLTSPAAPPVAVPPTVPQTPAASTPPAKSTAPGQPVPRPMPSTPAAPTSNRPAPTTTPPPASTPAPSTTPTPSTPTPTTTTETPLTGAPPPSGSLTETPTPAIAPATAQP